MLAVRTGRTAATILALAALVLTGCAAEPDPDASGSSPASVTPTTGTTATPTATSTPTPTPAADCLIGDWTTNESDLVAYYDQINAALAGSGATFTPTGSAGLSVRADGTYSWLPSVHLIADVSGTQILVDLAGSIDGSYTAQGDTIATQNDSTENLQITATVDGAAVDAGTIGDQIGGAPLTNSTYTCSASTLELTSSVGDVPVTTTLHR